MNQLINLLSIHLGVQKLKGKVSPIKSLGESEKYKSEREKIALDGMRERELESKYFSKNVFNVTLLFY